MRKLICNAEPIILIVRQHRCRLFTHLKPLHHDFGMELDLIASKRDQFSTSLDLDENKEMTE